MKAAATFASIASTFSNLIFISDKIEDTENKDPFHNMNAPVFAHIEGPTVGDHDPFFVKIFMSWVSKYNKQYVDQDTFNKRINIFAKNFETV